MLVYSYFYSSAERNFSGMKLIKNRLRNRLTELSLSNLMKIVIESPEKLTDRIWKKLLMCGIEKVDGLLSHSDSYLITYVLSLLITYQNQ